MFNASLSSTKLAELWQEVKDEENIWGDLKRAHLQFLKKLLEESMQVEVNEYLGAGKHERSPTRRSYRNGHYQRSLVTEMGVIEILNIPRTRDGGFEPKIFKRYARRQPAVNEMIKQMFIHGVATEKVGEILEPLLGFSCSRQTVSNICRSLDAEVEKFHKRGLKDEYLYLFFDGVYLRQRQALNSVSKPILVAYGIKHNGERELIDFRVAVSESEAAWEGFMTDLYYRGLRGENVKLIASDGDKGLINAIDMNYPFIARQRCWAHKARNVLSKVRKCDREEVKKGLIKIYSAKNRKEAIQAYWRWARKWRPKYPKAVKSLEEDFDAMIEFFRMPRRHWKKVRTTNVLERQFRDVKNRTRPMNTFNNQASCERIIFALFNYKNSKWQGRPIHDFTQKN